ncbi:MAG TPA: NTP transferase domain-containing protein [Candidatus Nanopelagicaceae bacterium]|nr:NTP transferase domain-containing protein [Candidatus Nanopelagicaceae bacterium]
MNAPADIFGVVLAAGEGSRFGGPKAPFIYEGERLIDRAVRVLRGGGCEQVWVVLGSWVGDVPNVDEILINPNWSIGLSSSLSLALHRAESSSALGLCIMLVDLPGITSDAVARVLASESDLAIATYEGKPTHPVFLGRKHWRSLVDSLGGDSGARAYLRQNDGVVQKIPIDDIADGTDLDVQPT